MTWLAILLSLAALGGSPNAASKPAQCSSLGAASAVPSKACKPAKKKKANKPKPKPKPTAPATNPSPRTEAPPSGGGGDTPTATPTPKPGATPTPTATPVATATPFPSRTNVDLTDTTTWSVRPSYRTLAAGRIDFNVNNRGEDDHNLTVRDAGAKDLGRIDLAPAETGTLTLTLSAGTYTLYCSLPQHEDAGMKATISVR